MQNGEKTEIAIEFCEKDKVTKGMLTLATDKTRSQVINSVMGVVPEDVDKLDILAITFKFPEEQKTTAINIENLKTFILKDSSFEKICSVLGQSVPDNSHSVDKEYIATCLIEAFFAKNCKQSGITDWFVFCIESGKAIEMIAEISKKCFEANDSKSYFFEKLKNNKNIFCKIN